MNDPDNLTPEEEKARERHRKHVEELRRRNPRQYERLSDEPVLAPKPRP